MYGRRLIGYEAGVTVAVLAIVLWFLMIFSMPFPRAIGRTSGRRWLFLERNSASTSVPFWVNQEILEKERTFTGRAGDHRNSRTLQA